MGSLGRLLKMPLTVPRRIVAYLKNASVEAAKWSRL